MIRRSFAPFAAVFALSAVACGTRSGGDPPVERDASALGSGQRIRDVGDPKAKSNGQNVDITAAVTLFADTYDETADGKSRGTIYIQDPDSQAPFSGLSLFGASFVPADLRVAPGDVMDYSGAYVELDHVGTAKFDPGTFLPQLDRPAGVFRYEYKLPEPKEIDPLDLNDFTKGRQWMNMLVTIKNCKVYDAPFNDGKGRVTAHITPDLTNRSSAVISNELYPLADGDVTAGKTYTQITGIVTWFFSFHLAPRSKADIGPEAPGP